MRSLLLGLAALVVTAVVVIALVDGNDDASPAGATATAPIAPPGVPATPVCATDPPGEGTEAEEARPVQLPLPAPRLSAAGSPGRALAEYLDAWHDRAWDRMALWASASWRQAVPDEAESRLLRRRYGTYRLRGWAVRARESEPSVARFRVLVAYRDIAPEIVRERLRFVVVREDAAGRPLEQGGRWGVLLSEDPDADARCPEDARGSD